MMFILIKCVSHTRLQFDFKGKNMQWPDLMVPLHQCVFLSLDIKDELSQIFGLAPGDLDIWQIQPLGCVNNTEKPACVWIKFTF